MGYKFDKKLEIAKELNDSLENLTILPKQIKLEFPEIAGGIQKRISRMGSEMEQVNNAFASIVENMMKPIVESVQRWVEIQIELGKFLPDLAARGWYLSFDFLDRLESAELLTFLKNKNYKQIEDKILDQFYSRKNEIKDKLSDKYPSRKSIVDLIFNLHEDEKYLASIPLCYTQADGISNNKWGINFFRGHSSGQLEIYRETKAENTIIGVLSEQLSVRNEQNQYGKNLKQDIKSSVNRHKIIHGQSIDYGSEVNSIKAILILDFLADLDEYWKEED